MTATLTDVTKPSAPRQFAALRALFGELASIPQKTQAHFARVTDAHVQRAQFASLPDDAVADLGLSAEDILSAPSYSDDLPFFMQTRYGRYR
jgi:hypothetical protein